MVTWPGSHGHLSGSEGSPCSAAFAAFLGLSTVLGTRAFSVSEAPQLPPLLPHLALVCLVLVTCPQGENSAWELGYNVYDLREVV